MFPHTLPSALASNNVECLTKEPYPENKQAKHRKEIH